jgi:Tfp pilus assembly protein PilV
MTDVAAGKSRGFALTEALVAILLLAIAMLGAAAALVDSLAGQRAALLQTRATDLAANLAEALRASPDAASVTAEIEAWQGLVRNSLPLVEAAADTSSALPGRVDIRLRWRGGRGTPASRLQLLVAAGGAS